MNYYRGLLLFNGDKFKIVRISEEDFAYDEICKSYLMSVTHYDFRWHTVFDTGKGVFSEEELNGKLDEAAKIFSVACTLNTKSEAE